MSGYIQQDYPGLCANLGLRCESCTEGTARELAKACPGLRGKMVGQLFVQIYTHPVCARMHAHFARAYAEAGSAADRKSAPGTMEPAALAAVA